MNERIKQLALEAGDYVNETYTGPVRSKTPGKIWEDGHIGWHTQFNEKFAELIVRECAWIANDPAPSVYDHDSYKLGRKWASEDVLKHFGVKE